MKTVVIIVAKKKKVKIVYNRDESDTRKQYLKFGWFPKVRKTNIQING